MSPLSFKWFQYFLANFVYTAHMMPYLKYDKQDQQGKAAFNERNLHMTQQQELVARSPGGPQRFYHVYI
jgi:hypothetical protein